MQLDVAIHRLGAEFDVPSSLEHLPYELVQRTDPTGGHSRRTVADVEVLTRVRDGALLALFPNRWRMRAIADNHPSLTPEPLLADS